MRNEEREVARASRKRLRRAIEPSLIRHSPRSGLSVYGPACVTFVLPPSTSPPLCCLVCSPSPPLPPTTAAFFTETFAGKKYPKNVDKAQLPPRRSCSFVSLSRGGAGYPSLTDTDNPAFNQQEG